jgi:hypothetical protein
MNTQPEHAERHCGNCGTTGDEGCKDGMEMLTELSTGCGLRLWSPLKPWQIAMQTPGAAFPVVKKDPIPKKLDGRTKAARLLREHDWRKNEKATA